MEFSILTLRIIFVGLIAFVTHPDGKPQMDPGKPPKALLMDAQGGAEGEHQARVLVVEGSVEGVEWPDEYGFPTLDLEQEGWDLSVQGLRTTGMAVGNPRLGAGRPRHAALPASDGQVLDHSWTPGLGDAGELKAECYARRAPTGCDVEARFLIPAGGSFETCHLAHLSVGGPPDDACDNLHLRSRNHGVEAKIVLFGFCRPEYPNCPRLHVPLAQALGNAKGYELRTRGFGFVLTAERWTGGPSERYEIRPLRVGPSEGVVTLVVFNELAVAQSKREDPHWHFEHFFDLLEPRDRARRVEPYVPVIVESIKTEPMNPGWCEPYLQCLEARAPIPHLPHSPSECDEANYP